MPFYVYLEVYGVNNLPTCTVESIKIHMNWLDMVAVIDPLYYIKINHSLAWLLEKKFSDEHSSKY